MLRLRMMRAPQKYVQGKDSLLQFHKEMKELGSKWLFICSRSGEKASRILMMFAAMRYSAEYLVQEKLNECGNW